MIRNLASILLCLFVSTAFGAPKGTEQALLQQLKNSTETTQKVVILRNLADACFGQDNEPVYLKQLIATAQKGGDKSALIDAYGDLAYWLIKESKVDSVRYYIDKIGKLKESDATLCWQSFLKMRLFDTELTGGQGSDATNEMLEKHTNLSTEGKSLYEQIESAYIIAASLEAQQKYSEAIPYSVAALKLAEDLPFKEGLKIRVIIMRTLKILYVEDAQFDKVTPLVEEFLALQERHYNQFLKHKRPYYPIESARLAEYTTLIINIRHLSPQKALYYYKRIMEMSDDIANLRDKYYYFLAINNYHLYKKDYPNALSSNDSLIKYGGVLAPYILPKLYNVSSLIYETTGRYKEALDALRQSYAIQDSLATSQSMEQLNKLQVKYDIDKLTLEKNRLEIRNKQLLLMLLSVFLLAFIFISSYLYRNLKKEKEVRMKLDALKTKAEESERMKRAFVGSICHEIRTPLNGIVGFTDLIFDKSIDEELRETFPKEIQKNTQLLTGLINSMIEVSNLDVSDEKLPCEPVDICSVCHCEYERILSVGKSEIDFRLDIPQGSLMIDTNVHYLALVIQNLLDNANKFTRSGEVVLECHADNVANRLLISVTDTGCGIAPEKHEEIFERFSKLNSFVPGNGLGLYLCRLIVHRLAGEVAVDASYKAGARLVVSLPL